MTFLAKIRLYWFVGLLMVPTASWAFYRFSADFNPLYFLGGVLCLAVGGWLIHRAKHFEYFDERAWKPPSVPSFNCAKCGVLVTTGQKYCSRHMRFDRRPPSL